MTWIDVQTALNDPLNATARDGAVQEHVEADGRPSPFFTHFANTKVLLPVLLGHP